MELLALPDAAPDLRDRFDADPAAPVPAALAGLWGRWDRARALGAPAEGPDPDEHLVRGDALAERRGPLEPVLQDGAEALARAAGAVSGRDFALLVADAGGVVVSAAGGGGFAGDARRLRLVEGASWSEARRGTNAIGTALAEDRAVAVLGGAHFGRRFGRLACYAAPIRNGAGQVVGVVDATSWAGGDGPDELVAFAVSTTAQALGAVLRARELAALGDTARRLVERTLDRVAGPAFVVDRDGRVARCNPAGRVWLGGVRPAAEAAFGVPFAALERAATGGAPGGLVVEGRAGALRLRVEPLLDAAGAVLAVAAYGEDLAPTRRPERARAAERPAGPDPFAEVFALDPATRAAVDFARRVAPSDLPVVLLSETGSGKELFAAALHRASRRAAGPFVPVNCGSLAPALLESELFGHGPGAFTGAERRGRDGLLHAASGGTLFLDEVAEMPPAMQTALLRVLEARRYARVGETETRVADVRVVCATCRDLPALVAAGTFRKDLYYRLKGVQLTLPPLRARADRLALARHLLDRAAAEDGGPPSPLTPALAAWIEAYGWPGNVRELKSVLAVARVLAGPGEPLAPEHLPPDVREGPPADAPVAGHAPLAEVERWAVERALAELGGNVSAAARRLGVARSTIYRMLQRG